MALSIKDDQTDTLAREVARRTGETLTGAIRTALAERLQCLSGRHRAPTAREKIHEILHRVDALPNLDDRSEDEILGYDEHGLPR
jgi:antitoxin VapB